jgi:hypothetical protein
MSKSRKSSTSSTEATAKTKPARAARPMLLFGLNGMSYVATPKRFAEALDAVLTQPARAEALVPTIKGVRPVGEPVGDLLTRSREELEALARRFDAAADKKAARTAARIKRLRARIADLEGSLQS